MSKIYVFKKHKKSYWPQTFKILSINYLYLQNFKNVFKYLQILKPKLEVLQCVITI